MVPIWALVGNTKLANSESPSEQNEISVAIVTALYEALSSKDVETVHRLLAPDLEWWFHGPPSHQYLMRLLTGVSSSSFVFAPISIVAFGPTVLAEGYDTKRAVSWVHAWTITDGVITHVKEYLNTSVTVKRFATAADEESPSSSPPYAEADTLTTTNCQSVWQSKVCGESVPGLVLALQMHML
ncbi:Senescence associated protein 20, partial [Cucurbita argyrosperma subsp. argyrosperma]